MSESQEARYFKNVVKNLANDAMATLEEMREECDKSPKLREKYHLLHHYLEYMRKLFEGGA